ncbi:hypothetical protein VNI00_006014 [Paramarasmius palmivorus]|uniref:Major facilitator superfamily (MFS) profile domain-containing protein n=1 Tax=Paramarasmius palmivorus TaxID=297713 RepID=A0AAW0DD56_9AGAR
MSTVDKKDPEKASATNSHDDSVEGLTEDIFTEDALDPVYQKKARLLNDAMQDVGKGRYIGLGQYQWALFVVTGFGWLVDNLWPIVTGLILPPVLHEFANPDDGPFLKLGQNIGLLVGAVFWGIGSDIWGRKVSFNITLFITGVFAIAGGASPDFVALCSFAAVWSIGVGGNLPVDSAIFLEFIPASHQYLLTVLSIWWAFGQLIGSLVAWPLIGNFSCPQDASPCPKESNMGWRYFLYTMGGLMMLLWAIRFFLFKLYESPKYLMGRGLDAEAVDVIHKVAAYNGNTSTLTVEELEGLGDLVRKEAGASSAVRKQLAKFDSGHIKGLFATRKLAWSTSLLIILWGLIGLAFPLYNAFVTYFLSTRGADFGDGSVYITYRNQVILSVIGVPGALLAGYMVEIPLLGRRGSLAISTLLTGAFILASTTARSSAALLGWNSAYSFTSNVMYGVLYALTPELFPTKDRGTGNALCAGVNRIFGVMHSTGPCGLPDRRVKIRRTVAHSSSSTYATPKDFARFKFGTQLALQRTMSNVYFPAQVVVIFRRIFNVFSGLSISNQYLLKHSKETLKDGEREEQASGTAKAIWSWEGPWKRGAMNDTLHLRGLNAEKFRNRSASTESVTSNENPTPDEFEPPPEMQNPPEPEVKDTIHQLLSYPALYDPLRKPRNPIVLCHGLYGFDTRGPSTFPSMRMHYWSNVLNILRGKLDAEVIITSVPGTGSIAERAEHLDRQLREKAPGREVNFMAHSMGGLDCRHLITHCKPDEYTPVSLTTISTPHRGSPFMDWCSENLGLGRLAQEERELLTKASAEGLSRKSADGEKSSPPTFSSLSLSSLPSSFTTLLMSILDSPAYANLTSNYLNNVFNPATPDDPNVKYFSIAGRMPNVSIWHPFWLPKMVLDEFEQKERRRLKENWEKRDSLDWERPIWARPEEWGNDGLVTIQSAKWGEFLGTMEGCDHWELRGARGIEFGVDLPAIPAIGLGPPSSVTGGTGNNSSMPNHDHQDGWNLKDWGWFLKAWRKEEKIHREAASKAQTKAKGDRQKAREEEREKDDAVIKASTDKLSVVFDWLTERVPSPPLPAMGGRKPAGSDKETQAFKDKEQSNELDKKEGRKGKRNDLATKHDLERFYVALSRKLYDEGL